MATRESSTTGTGTGSGSGTGAEVVNGSNTTAVAATGTTRATAIPTAAGNQGGKAAGADTGGLSSAAPATGAPSTSVAPAKGASGASGASGAAASGAAPAAASASASASATAAAASGASGGGPSSSAAGGTGTRLGVGAGSNKYASSSLYVGDLSKDVTEATLFELFNAVGPVASIRVCRDGATRQSLGYAYVNFHSTKDAERALDTMNFANIKGRQCRIMWSQRDPSLRRSNKGNVFVKCLHESIDNKTLYDTFSVFGNILSCKVATNEDGTSRQYGYVHYVDEASAKKAIEGVNGMSINNKVVEACEFKSRKERPKNEKFTNVYVKYIPRHCDESMCKDAFIKIVSDELKLEEPAQITHSMFWKQTYGVSGCFNFGTHEQAKCAVSILDGYDLRGVYPDPDPATEADSEHGSKEDGNGDTTVTKAKNAEHEDEDDGSSDQDKDQGKEKESEKEKAKEQEEDLDDGKNEKKESKGSDEVDDASESKAETSALVDAVAGKKDSVKKSEQRLLYATRAQKRKARDFQMAKEKGIRGGYGGGSGSGGRRGAYNARYYLGGNLYVKHLKPEVDDERLKEMFADFGEIQSAKVMKDENQQSKQFGFVAFKSKQAATRALHEMNLRQQGPNAKPLYVSRAQSRQVRNKRFNAMNRRGAGGQRGYNMYQGPFSNQRNNMGGGGSGPRGGGGGGGVGAGVGAGMQGGYNPQYRNTYAPSGGIYGLPTSQHQHQGGHMGVGPQGPVVGGGQHVGQHMGAPGGGAGLASQFGGLPGGLPGGLQGGLPGGLPPQLQQQGAMNMGGMRGMAGMGGMGGMGGVGRPNIAAAQAAQAAAQAAATMRPTMNPQMLPPYPPMQVGTNLMNQAFMNRGAFAGNLSALQQLFPQNMTNLTNQGRQQGIGSNATGLQQGMATASNLQGGNFNQQQTSQTNQMMQANSRVNQIQSVTGLQSTGTAGIGTASSAQMAFPTHSVPRTGVSVQSGGVVATTSQLPSQPTNASMPQQGQSASMLSAGGRDSAAMKESHPLTQQMLSRIATPAEKKRLIGERLFPKIQVVEPRLAGKITGMLLEMDNKILLSLLSDNTALHSKINEALAVLQEHHKSQQNASNANRTSASNNAQ